MPLKFTDPRPAYLDSSTDLAMDSNFFVFPVEQKDMWYKLDKVWPGWPFMGHLWPVCSFLLREDLSTDVPSRRWKVDVSLEMGGSFPLSAQQAKGHTYPGEEALNIPWTECLSDEKYNYTPLWNWLIRPQGLARIWGFLERQPCSWKCPVKFLSFPQMTWRHLWGRVEKFY